MKNIILFLSIIALTTTTVNAQTMKKDLMIGGNFHLNTDDSYTRFSFTPNAGLFIIDNFAVGANLNFFYTKMQNKSSTFGLGPFVRYYFSKETNKIRPILHGSFAFLNNSTKSANNASVKTTGIDFLAGGGAALFISNDVSIDGLVCYHYTKFKDYSSNGELSFNIGFQIYINKSSRKK